MKIAIINLINITYDTPKKIRDIFKLKQKTVPTDKDTKIVELGKAFADEGHEVTIYISDFYKPLKITKYKNLKIKYLTTRLKKFFLPTHFPICPSLRKELKRGNFDLIISMDYFQFGTIITAFVGRRSVLVWQDLNVYPRIIWPAYKLYNITLGKIVQNLVRGFVSKTHSAEKFLIKCGVKKEKLYGVIPSGVDTNLFCPRKADKKKFGVGKKQKIILRVSRLYWTKGLEYLIKAMKKVIKKYPNALLIIKGNGPEKEKLLKLIKRLDLEKNVRILTQRLSIRDLVNLYNISEFTVVTSLHETVGFIVSESMACRKTVIATDIPGVRDVVKDKKTGFLIRPKNVNQLAQKINYLLINPSLAKKLGKKARENVKKEYGWNVIAKKFIDIAE